MSEAGIDYAAGGGIVVDSDPEVENMECLHKLEAFRIALSRGKAAGFESAGLAYRSFGGDADHTRSTILAADLGLL